MLPLEEEQPVALPERKPTKPLLNEYEANKQAYYAAYANSKRSLIDRSTVALQLQQAEFERLYGKIKTDLTTVGESQELEAEKVAIKKQAIENEKEDLKTIALDPMIPLEEKVLAFENQGNSVPSLEDNYRQSITAENHGVTKKDELAQEKNVVNYVDRNLQAEKDWKNLHSVYASSLDPNYVDFGLSATLNFAPGRTGTLAANLYAAMSNDHSFATKAKYTLLPGSAYSAMGKMWKEWDNKQKRDGLIRIIRYMESSTALDSDKVEMLLQTLENPDQPWWATTLGNVSGILDATLIGGFAKAPIKTTKEFVKWTTTYDAAKDKAAIKTVKGWFTGKTVAGADVGLKTAKEAASPRVEIRTASEMESQVINAATKDAPPPNSPLGIEVINNPDKAAKSIISSVLDETGKVGEAVAPGGKGQAAESILPKNVEESLREVYPDVAEKLNTFTKALKPESEINPALYDDAIQRSEIAQEIETIQRAKYPNLQLSNTYVDFRFGDTSYIKAIYGETPTRGWLTESEAKGMLHKLKGDIPDDTFKQMEVTYNNKNKEWYITHNIEKPFNPNVIIGDYGTKFQIPFTTKEIDISAIARTKWINWVLPHSSRISQGLSSAALATEMAAAQRIAQLNQYITKFVMSKKELFPDLHAELKLVHEEESAWKTVPELLADKVHLSETQKKDLAEAYYSVKSLSDHAYEMANRRHRGALLEEDAKAIYNSDGSLLGYGKQITPNEKTPLYVWNLDENIPVILKRDEKGNIILDGRKIVKLHKPMEAEGQITKTIKLEEHNKFEYAILGGKAQLGELPTHTLTKRENYIPWYHTADFFVQRTPKNIRVNGASVTSEDDLRRYSERIAGARTLAEAEKMAAELAAEHGDKYSFKAVLRNENVLDELVDMHEEASKYAAWEKQRGKRLDGFDPLDDPIRSVVKLNKSLIQLASWDDMERHFRKRFTETYSKFFQEGQMPRTPDKLVLGNNDKTPENVTLLAAGKRELEWFNGIFNSMVESDRAVGSFFHTAANTMNKYNIPGDRAIRDLAKQGNIFLRVPNAAATHLLLYSNIAKQWVVQTQNIWTLHMLDPAFIKYGLPNVMPFIFGVLGKSKYFQHEEGNFIKIAKFIGGNISGIKGKEWDDMYNGFVNSGMLQAVDLNSMVLGLKHHDNFTLSPEVHERIAKGLTQTIGFPGNAAKIVGYTPAELSNLAGAWIYAYKQYQKAHPGVDMTNTHHIEQVKAKTLALTGSMAGSSDTMSYQRGMWTTLFKFMPIQSKQLALMTTSKHTTKQEKLRMAWGQAIFWGTAGTVGGSLIHDGVNKWMSDEEKEIFNKYEGGIHDLIGNFVLDTIIRATLGIDEEKDTSLAWSHTIAPFNQGYGIPAVEVFWNLYKAFTDAQAANPRIAAVGAYDTVTSFITAVSNRMKINGDYQTIPVVESAIAESPMLFKAYDNLAKGYIMLQTGKLVSKHGNPRELAATYGDAMGRMFGVYTKPELDKFRSIDEEKAKKAAHKAVAKDIFDFIMKNRTDIINMDKQSRATELDKILFITVGDDPEGLDIIAKDVQRRLHYAKKEFGEQVAQQIEHHYSISEQQVRKAKEEIGDGALSDLLQILLEKRNK
jgi:hypothetical protein